MDLLNLQKLLFFRLMVVIGTVSDVVFNPEKKLYEPVGVELHGASKILTGEWNSTNTILPEQTMSVQMDASRLEFLTDNITVLLSMGIEFGNVGFAGQPEAVKYAGCGKVIAAK